MQTEFEQKVWQQTRRIPPGKVITYAALARKVGFPHAARAVGNALNKSPGMPRVPCHRVVKSSGEVGGFASGSRKKVSLLEKEGVVFEKGAKRKIDLNKFGVWLSSPTRH